LKQTKNKGKKEKKYLEFREKVPTFAETNKLEGYETE
jgi:hypothetical protein